MEKFVTNHLLKDIFFTSIVTQSILIEYYTLANEKNLRKTPTKKFGCYFYLCY